VNESDSKCRCYGEGCRWCAGGYAVCELCGAYLDEVPSMKVGGLRYCRPDGLFAMGLDALDTAIPAISKMETVDGTGRAKAVA
jgi:hypothetical protein